MYRYWKDKYNMVFKAHLETTMRREIEKLTTSTFTNLTEFSEIQAFSRLINTNYYLYYARTGIEINTEKFTEFLESWLYAFIKKYIVTGMLLSFLTRFIAFNRIMTNLC